MCSLNLDFWELSAVLPTWSPISTPELQIFLGIPNSNCKLLLPRIQNFWQLATLGFATGLGTQAQQYQRNGLIKYIRFLHISDTYSLLSAASWWQKLEQEFRKFVAILSSINQNFCR
ncbi:hypothetical protein BGX38DRAFT_1177052 [Terfezia claveryi]|nr:hypothetical protein BGX38DRAFT_1177052 [Terfezia claveryi]